MRWGVLVLFLAAFEVSAAVPQLSDFNTTQFQTSGGIIGVKSGAALTNTTLVGSPTLNGMVLPYGAANYVVYGATNSTLPNSRVLSAGSNVTITESGTNLTVIAAAGGGTNGLPDPGGNGIVVRTATNTTVYQTIVGVANETVVTNGDGVLGAPTVALAPKARFLSFTNVAEMEAASVADGTPVVLKGYYVEGDAPAVTYVFVAGDTSTVDNGSVVTNAAGRFKIQTQGIVDPRWFGAQTNYVRDVTTVFTNNSTNIVLSAPLPFSVIGWTVAVRRGNTSADAAVTPVIGGGGAITSFTIDAPGQGYINTPLILKSSGNGSGGTFTAVLTDGQLTGVTVGGGGGTLYDATSIFVVKSADIGTTNGPMRSQQFTVTSQVGTTIGMSGTPLFSSPLYPADDVGKAIFYKDNATFFQAAFNYATNVGATVVIPAGDWATGPLYLNYGQNVVGLNRNLSKLYFTQGNLFSPYRRSVLAANDINFSNGRQAWDGNPLTDVHISDLTIDGNAQWQGPLDNTGWLNGQFALMGINALNAARWTVERMVITNCQGDGLYVGSVSPTAGPNGDWSLVRTRDISVRDVFISGNWRNGSQMGNVQDTKWSDFRFQNNSVGYYETFTRRHMGAASPYSDEEIDMEANAGAVSGANHFSHGEISTIYGEGINQFIDQRVSYLDDVTFKDCKGNYFAQSGLVSQETALNQEHLGEWTTLNNCKFIATSTNFTYPFLTIRYRGTRITGCYFEGNGSVLVDYTVGNLPYGYEMTGVMFSHNQFNLKPLTGATAPGVIQVLPISQEVHKFIWDDSNIILAGSVDIRQGTRDSDSTLASASGLYADSGYVYQTAGGAAVNFWSEISPAGLGAQDFTINLKLAKSYIVTSAELFRLTYGSVTELAIYDRTSVAGKTLDISWNPTNIGATTITVPTASTLDKFGAWQTYSYLKPINLSLVRKIGSVWNIAVLDQGTNYATAPTIGLTGFGGSGATATAQISVDGHLTNIYVLNPGTGFTTNFLVTITSASGSNAVAVASVGRLQVYTDDQLIYTDTGTNISHAFTTGSIYAQLLVNAGNANDRLYSYAIWNYALTEMDIRRFLISGVEPAHQWGTWGGAAGCLTYTKFNSGIGYFFPDLSPNGMNVWGVQDATIHSIPKTSGQLRKRITSVGTATTSFSWAASNAIPAHARITSVLARPVSGTPTVAISFNSAATALLTPATLLVAAVTNYLPLVPEYAYGTTNRPVYAYHSGSATVDYIINYSLDQGGLDGSTIQSGIVTAPGGLGSTSVIAATAIDATGWTNTFGVNAMVYAEGTGLQFTVYNAAGTPVYTNAATVGSASIALQKGAKMIVIAGTGVSGRAVPW